MGDSLSHQGHQRFIIQHIATVIHDPVLTMTREGVQGDIRHNAQLRKALLDRPYRLLRQAFRIPGLGRVLAFAFGGRYREQRHRRNAQFNHFLEMHQEAVNAVPLNPRHGGHRLGLSLARQHEDRIDEVIHTQPGLPNQPAGKIITAVAAQAGGGERSAVATQGMSSC